MMPTQSALRGDPSVSPPHKRPYVVTVATAKGGSGKTTLAAALATELALRMSVLALDFDQQGHLTRALGYERGGGGMTHWLMALVVAPPPGIIASQGVGRPDLLPADYSTGRLDMWHSAMKTPETHLRDRIPGEFGQYDAIVIDTAAHGFLVEMSLMAADAVVVPVSLRSVDIDGANLFAYIHNTVLSARAPRTILVPNRVDPRARVTMQSALSAVETLAAEHGWMLGPRIPETVEIEKAHAQGATVRMTRPTHPVVAQFAALAALVLPPAEGASAGEEMTT